MNDAPLSRISIRSDPPLPDCHDSRIRIRVSDLNGEDITVDDEYWAVADGADDATGSVVYKLLPMERG